MARPFALFLALIALTLVGACGGDDDSGSPTATTQDGEQTSESQSTTDADAGWTAVLSGHLTGELTNKLDPHCLVANEPMYSVVLQGSINGQRAVVTVLSAAPGTFDLKHSADEAPTVDVATSSDAPAEWFVVAGEASDGELTIEGDGSGSVSATLPPITAGDVGPLTLTATWTCPTQ